MVYSNSISRPRAKSVAAVPKENRRGTVGQLGAIQMSFLWGAFKLKIPCSY